MGRKVVAAVVACVLLLGCTGQEESPPTSAADPPSTEPSAEEATTSEPTTIEPPDLDPPVFPEDAREDTPAGAVAIAGYFLEVYNYTNNTNDTKYFTAIAGPDCNYCSNRISQAENNNEIGTIIVGGELSTDLDEANVLLPTADQPFYTVQIEVDEAPTAVRDPDGTESEEISGSSFRMAIGVQYSSSVPTVLGVNYE